MQERVSTYKSFASCIVFSKKTLSLSHSDFAACPPLGNLLLSEIVTWSKTPCSSLTGAQFGSCFQYSFHSGSPCRHVRLKRFGDFVELKMIRYVRLVFRKEKNICVCGQNVITKAFHGRIRCILQTNRISSISKLAFAFSKVNFPATFAMSCTRVKRIGFEWLRTARKPVSTQCNELP